MESALLLLLVGDDNAEEVLKADNEEGLTEDLCLCCEACKKKKNHFIKHFMLDCAQWVILLIFRHFLGPSFLPLKPFKEAF